MTEELERYCPIPENWTAEEALVIAAFLEQVIGAIWRTHGSAMGHHLQRVRMLAEAGCPETAGVDDIPF